MMPVTHRIRRIEFPEVAAKLPQIESFAPASLAQQAALYICALGFEPRCVSVAQALAKAEKRFGRCLVLEYETNRGENEVNRLTLMHALAQISDSTKSVDVDAIDFIDRIRDELRVLAAATKTLPRVTLDISVLANRALFRSMKPLLEANINLTVLYAEAEVYHPTEATYQKNAKLWADDSRLGLEQGVADIRISRDFPGQQLEPLPDCVVVFPSFNASRTNAVLTKIDPALVTNPTRNVVWLVGVPHLEKDHWRIDAMKQINRIDDSKVHYEVSTFSYLQTLQLLHTLYRERGAQFNITVSPLGSKLQALGCVLFCYQQRDVRVIYSIPSRYNAKRYSDGCRALWQLEFGNTESLRSLLSSAGKLCMEKVEEI